MKRDKIHNLAGAYFSQDFDLDYGSADDVLRGFLRAESSNSVRELLDEIDGVLAASMSEPELQEVWAGFHTGYEPEDDGRTYREWFEHIRELMTASG